MNPDVWTIALADMLHDAREGLDQANYDTFLERAIVLLGRAFADTVSGKRSL